MADLSHERGVRVRTGDIDRALAIAASFGTSRTDGRWLEVAGIAPAAAEARSRNSLWLRASRTELVATARTAATSSFRYCAAMAASTPQARSMASRLIFPVRKTLSPSRVTSRAEARMRGGAAGVTSAASMRMELLPISIAA